MKTISRRKYTRTDPIALVLREVGFSLRECARYLHVSHERVRQITPGLHRKVKMETTSASNRRYRRDKSDPEWAIQEKANWCKYLAGYASMRLLRKTFQIPSFYNLPNVPEIGGFGLEEMVVGLYRAGLSYADIETLTGKGSYVGLLLSRARKHGKLNDVPRRRKGRPTKSKGRRTSIRNVQMKILREATTDKATWRVHVCTGCEHKYFDAARQDRLGNPLCGLAWPVGKRCTFKGCPLLTIR